MPSLLRDSTWAWDSAQTLTPLYPPMPFLTPTPTYPPPPPRWGGTLTPAHPAWAAPLGRHCWPCFLSLEPRCPHPTSFTPLGGAFDSLSHLLPLMPSLYRNPKRAAAQAHVTCLLLRSWQNPVFFWEQKAGARSTLWAAACPAGSVTPSWLLALPKPPASRFQMPRNALKVVLLEQRHKVLILRLWVSPRAAEKADVHVSRFQLPGKREPGPCLLPAGLPCPKIPTGSESPPLILFSPPAM